MRFHAVHWSTRTLPSRPQVGHFVRLGRRVQLVDPTLTESINPQQMFQHLESCRPTPTRRLLGSWRVGAPPLNQEPTPDLERLIATGRILARTRRTSRCREEDALEEDALGLEVSPAPLSMALGEEDALEEETLGLHASPPLSSWAARSQESRGAHYQSQRRRRAVASANDNYSNPDM